MDSRYDVGGQEIQKSAISQAGGQLAKRFGARVTEMAREGNFGSLKTRKSLLKQVFILLASLLERPTTPVLIFGEKGSGKRRVIDEFFFLSNFYNRIQGVSTGKLKVYFPDFLKKGFTENFSSPETNPRDLIVIEDVERLTPELQNELAGYLSVQRDLATKGVMSARVVVTTTRALSLRVISGEFRRDLFALITEAACFIPSLNERPEDHLDLVSQMLKEIKGANFNPEIPAWFMDSVVSVQLWSGNLDELKAVIKYMLDKQPNMQLWNASHLPARLSLNVSSSGGPFKIHQTPDITGEIEEKKKMQAEIIRASGDRKVAAKTLGMSDSEFLRKLIRHGIRIS